MNLSFMPTTSRRKNPVVSKLISDARRAEQERRAQGRAPFFHPIQIRLTDESEPRSAFTRDIAPNGIGLLHAFPVDPQMITVTLNMANEQFVRFLVEIEWCVGCGDIWYISGGRIVDTDVVES